MDKQELIIKVLNTLELVEVKGFNNINYMCGVMSTLRKELNNGGGDNGVQSDNMDK